MWKLLKFLEIPFEIDRILCFECGGARFYWNSDQLPEMCLNGLHRMEKGSFCVPDVILADKRAPMPIQTHSVGYEPCKMSVLRVDGEVHNKRRVKCRDRGQERELKRLKIPYFVVENEFFKVNGRAPNIYRIDYTKIPMSHLDYLLSCWMQTLHQNLYVKYNNLREVKATKLV